MTIDRNEKRSEKQEADLALRGFFAEVHADDRVPSYREMARTAQPARARSAIWRPAFAVLAVVAMAAGIAWLSPGLQMPGLRGTGSDSLSETQQLALARGLSSFDAPLDFLLETPGRELLYAPASFELMENLGETTP